MLEEEEVRSLRRGVRSDSRSVLQRAAEEYGLGDHDEDEDDADQADGPHRPRLRLGRGVYTLQRRAEARCESQIGLPVEETGLPPPPASGPPSVLPSAMTGAQGKETLYNECQR